jgi:hypothetical protein
MEDVCFSGDCSLGVTDFVGFRPRFGVIVSLGDDCSVIEVCLRRVLVTGAVCGVVGRLKTKNRFKCYGNIFFYDANLRFVVVDATGVVLLRFRPIDLVDKFGSSFSPPVSICS